MRFTTPSNFLIGGVIKCISTTVANTDPELNAFMQGSILPEIVPHTTSRMQTYVSGQCTWPLRIVDELIVGNDRVFREYD